MIDMHFPLANTTVMFHFRWQREVRDTALLSSSTFRQSREVVSVMVLAKLIIANYNL
jgi:hypothetical protein